MNSPQWIPSAKSPSIRKWAENLHKQARQTFEKDKTHAQILFFFKDNEGLVSINPIPPKTDHLQIFSAIRRTITDNNLYAVIHIGECWTYFPKNQKDHTFSQLIDGEMKVSELRDEDKTEALCLRMESRDGDCLVLLDQILRKGDDVVLGEAKRIKSDVREWF